MHAITKLVPLILFGGALAVLGCDQNISVDSTGAGVPAAGVIRGNVVYSGPPPCTQNGHVVGNAVVLVFDRRNPPPPSGLGNTAVNFGVVAGDTLFHSLPVTTGPGKVCPAANAPQVQATSSYAIAPMTAGSYVLSAFFDYTGDFFATFKFRQLPEATDIGGGYIDLNDATSLVPDPTQPQQILNPDGGAGNIIYPLREKQSDPNYLPVSLPVNVGTPAAVPPTSLRNVPEFTMPSNGYLADNVNVTIIAKLNLARPYFYPEGAILPAGAPNAHLTINAEAPSTATRPTTGGKAVATPQNPSGNVDYIPVLSFPQDIQLYAQPSVPAIALNPKILDTYQAAFPQLKLHAGLPTTEAPIGADTIDPKDPFHMQLGTNTPGAAPGGNGGIYVWWNGTHTQSDCGGCPDPTVTDSIPENAQIYRMWPLIVLAKLNDLPKGGSQPNSNDPESLVPQGTDLTKPAVIIQGITLIQDSLFLTSGAAILTGAASSTPLTYPDYAGGSNRQDHVSVALRPSTLCLDPRAPDNGGVLVTTGASIDPKTKTVQGPFPPGDTKDGSGLGVVVDSAILSNPQLAQLVNRRAVGTTNGLIAGCLPTGRYQINMVYPTGQAWTTPNEIGSCAAAEGNTLLTGTGSGNGLIGNCSTKPRPVLYSQGTRAVVEITPAEDPANCQTNPAPGKTPAVPFACTSLCSDPSLDPTATPPCSKPIPPVDASGTGADAGH